MGFELHFIGQFVSNQYLVLIPIGKGRVKLGCRYVGAIVVLIVSMVGVWSEERS